MRIFKILYPSRERVGAALRCMASPAKIEAIALGGGQEVGRSCVLVKLGGYRVLLDCGIHTAYTDERCFPRFELLLDGHVTGSAAGAGGRGGRDGSSLPDGDACSLGVSSKPAGGAAASPAGQQTSPYAHCVDAVFITHYHLDHVGALPHLIGVLGYRGPVYMTSATRAIAQVGPPSSARALRPCRLPHPPYLAFPPPPTVSPTHPCTPSDPSPGLPSRDGRAQGRLHVHGERRALRHVRGVHRGAARGCAAAWSTRDDSVLRGTRARGSHAACAGGMRALGGARRKEGGHAAWLHVQVVPD
eukprot:scaffold15017_cov89-Isochrysis_galbana.AAC.1